MYWCHADLLITSESTYLTAIYGCRGGTEIQIHRNHWSQLSKQASKEVRQQVLRNYPLHSFWAKGGKFNDDRGVVVRGSAERGIRS